MRGLRIARIACASAAVMAGLVACSGSNAPSPEEALPCGALGGLGPKPQADAPPAAAAEPPSPIRVLLFTKTAEFRHPSIADAQEWFASHQSDGLDVDATESSAPFTDDGLQPYDVVAFVNTTGDVLDDEEQAALQRWVDGGGGFVGVHAAADTEHDWPWYGDMVGASFRSHPPGLQSATLVTELPDDPTTAALPAEWNVTDELYNFDRNPRQSSDILVTVDESSGTGADGKPVGEGFTQEGDHPISWSHQVGDGRSWYTALGHDPSMWDDERFGAHLLAGIRWAASPGRWEHRVISDELEAPSALDVASSGLVLWTERSGTLQLWDPATGLVHTVGRVPTRVEGEGGFIGVRLAPDAATSGHVFTYATEPGDGPTGANVLRRYTLDADCHLDPDSAEEILSVPNSFAGHQGGDLLFLPDGTLLIGTGDDTAAGSTGYSPPGALDTAANPDDLRGKVLRINPDGSVPDGNLFPGGDGGAPEIYAMGLRNPYRLAATPDGTRIWWGDIGPDAGEAAPQGPQGFDELDTATEPGDYGWPTCIGPNLPYHPIDPETGAVGEPYPCFDKVPSVLAYDYANVSEPALGSSVQRRRYDDDAIELLGRALMAGPYYAPGRDKPLELPIGEVLLLHEFARNRLLAATPDGQGHPTRVRRIAPWAPINTPVDVEVAPDGSLYILETGKWSATTAGGARLTRLAYSPDGTFPKLPETLPAVDGPDVARTPTGEELYQLQCSTCHGADGTGGRGPSLIDIADRLTLDEHLEVVREGRGLMPAWEDILSPDELEAVVEYERTLRSDD